MKHIGLFEGIGGFSIAARWMQWETVAWCEIDPFCQKVLKYHFPDAEALSDIKTTDFKKYANRIDILTGGFPCQPYSTAGKRKGTEDARHLWPEMLRAIREIQPKWVVGENVPGIVNWDGGVVFQEVCTSLETEGYEVQPYILPASAVEAPHERYRVWFIAFKNTGSNGCKNGEYEIIGNIGNIGKSRTGSKERDINSEVKSDVTNLNSDGFNGSDSENEIDASKRRLRVIECIEPSFTANADVTRREELDITTKSREQNRLDWAVMYPDSPIKPRKYFGQERKRQLDRPNSGDGTHGWDNFPTQPPICFGDDGISSRLDSITFSSWRNESIKAGGNAVVPKVPFEIFKAIEKWILMYEK